MLGYARNFMDEKYDEIIDFAELQEFQDRPFRQLSSGMKSRLAFSIASLVQPNILILDEMLSVGGLPEKERNEDEGDHSRWSNDDSDQPLHAVGAADLHQGSVVEPWEADCIDQ